MEIAPDRCDAADCKQRKSAKFPCRGCGVRAYCSKECRIASWASHKKGDCALFELHPEVAYGDYCPTCHEETMRADTGCNVCGDVFFCSSACRDRSPHDCRGAAQKTFADRARSWVHSARASLGDADLELSTMLQCVARAASEQHLLVIQLEMDADVTVVAAMETHAAVVAAMEMLPSPVAVTRAVVEGNLQPKTRTCIVLLHTGDDALRACFRVRVDAAPDVDALIDVDLHEPEGRARVVEWLNKLAV
jgi:hypothetical protein